MPYSPSNSFYPQNSSPSNLSISAKEDNNSKKNSNSSQIASLSDIKNSKVSSNAISGLRNVRDSSVRPRTIRSSKKCSRINSNKRKNSKPERKQKKCKSLDNRNPTVGNSSPKPCVIARTLRVKKYVGQRK